jgi:hypothetical protein
MGSQALLEILEADVYRDTIQDLKIPDKDTSPTTRESRKYSAAIYTIVLVFLTC